LGKEPKDEPDWLGFDKLAKMIGEMDDEDSTKPEAAAEPLPEKTAEPDPAADQESGVASKD
jgi:hypothetical protein